MTSFPDLSRVIAAFDAEQAEHVVIGGFAVIAHQYLRTTEDVDLLIPDDRENDLRILAALRRLKARRRDGEPVDEAYVVGRSHVRVEGDGGIVDLLRGGEPPLDFDTVSASAIESELDGVPIRICGLASLVGFKRLSGRPRDRADLEELESLHDGELPLLRIPGLDD